jgi:adiponectin receptor
MSLRKKQAAIHPDISPEEKAALHERESTLLGRVFGSYIDDWYRAFRKTLHMQEQQTELMQNFHADNCHMRSGFRNTPSNSFRYCVSTVFTLHNDTLNIWTHLAAAVTYGMFAFYTYTLRSQCDETAWKWLYVVFGYISVFLASAAYHTFRCHSVDAFYGTLICDLLGVVVTVTTCNYLTISYELRDFPQLQMRWHVVNLSCWLLLTAVVPVLIKFNMTGLRTALTSAYTVIGFLVHMHVEQFDERVHIAFDNHTVMALMQTYAISAIALLVRNVKIPERFAHGCVYDVFGASHQVFHVLIALAPIPLLRAYWQLYVQNHCNLHTETSI